MTVELDLEEISLYQGVDSYTLIFRLSETFSSDGERNLALLEVEVNWSEDGDNSFCGMSC